MNEKWEICTIFFSPGLYTKTTISPTKAEIRKSKLLSSVEQELSQLLADGWEPFAASQEDANRIAYHFRRHIS